MHLRFSAPIPPSTISSSVALRLSIHWRPCAGGGEKIRMFLSSPLSIPNSFFPYPRYSGKLCVLVRVGLFACVCECVSEKKTSNAARQSAKTQMSIFVSADAWLMVKL